MPRLPEKLLLLVALAAVAAGCKPKIGEECQLSEDCSAAGDRLCDITAPGGYCTIYNCEPNTCPEDESLCVEFGAQRSPALACQSEQIPSPYARTFCMATCESNDDCRAGYSCVDLTKGLARSNWGALLIDKGRGDRACLADFNTEPVPAEAESGVCRSRVDGSSSGGAPSTSEPPAGGAGGESSVPAESGAGGAAAGAAGAGDAGGQGGAGG